MSGKLQFVVTPDQSSIKQANTWQTEVCRTV